MTSKAFGIALAGAETVRLETPGGGGWGDPFRRDPAAVARDVACGYVSAAVARGTYGVVLDAAGAVDDAATAALKGARA